MACGAGERYAFFHIFCLQGPSSLAVGEVVGRPAVEESGVGELKSRILFGESLAGDLAGRGVNDDGQDAFVYYFVALLQCGGMTMRSAT